MGSANKISRYNFIRQIKSFYIFFTWLLSDSQLSPYLYKTRLKIEGKISKPPPPKSKQYEMST